MILVARLITRLVTFLLLVILAVAGIVVAVFCIGTGDAILSLSGLASLLDLGTARDAVDNWLGRLESPGSIAVTAALSGLGAMLLGLVLLVGILVPRRERLVELTSDARGTVAARRRPLAQAATALTEQVRGVTEARVRVKPRRYRGGRLSVRASRTRSSEARQLETAVRDQLTNLTGPSKLKARIDVPRRGARVQ